MADVVWSNIIGNKTLEDGGYAGDLLEVAMLHLVKAKEDGTLTEGQVGEIYAVTISAVFQQAIGYEMQKENQEAVNDQVRRRSV